VNLRNQLFEIGETVKRMDFDVQRVTAINFGLINWLVNEQQKARLDKSYRTADSIRDLLESVGIVIIRGTNGYDPERVPAVLKGRPIDDGWEYRVLTYLEYEAMK
jgi:cysteinyl-tRNA synthetase